MKRRRPKIYLSMAELGRQADEALARANAIVLVARASREAEKLQAGAATKPRIGGGPAQGR
ncbi:MAG TPA: hypothetical protein VHU77_11395 [Candidatus Limnocylindria bacterium]|jgi:hypothetical protein|nr:hypothetical protein [Candidatus Limnocylindria bacterium]